MRLLLEIHPNRIDLMDHEEISSSNAQSEEDNFRNPTCSNHLTNGECKTSTLETKIKLLGNPNGMKTTHLIQETTCNDLNKLCTSGIMRWGKDCLEEFPESLVFDEIWSPKEKVWNGIDVAEAGDKAEEFKTYQTYNLNGNVMTEVTLDSQECRESSMTELELWFSSQDFRTEFDKVEDTFCNDDIRTEIVLNIKVLRVCRGSSRCIRTFIKFDFLVHKLST